VVWTPDSEDGGGGAKSGRQALRGGQPSLASLRTSVDFLRAAVFRWMTPLVTALSSVRMAARTAAPASPADEASVLRAVLTAERTLLRTARLRNRRLSLCFMRLAAELVLANSVFLLPGRSDATRKPTRPPPRVSTPPGPPTEDPR
jgi:hypothetical protein